MKVTKTSSYYLLAIILIFMIHAVYLNCVAEDAFISFRFAKNLAAGNGLTWNIGEQPVEGYTNFLWVIICALAEKLKFDIPLFAQIIGVFTSVFTIIYTYKFTHRLLNIKYPYSLVPCVFLAVSGPFATWAASGMEINFFGLFLLMGCYYFTSYWRFNSRKSLLLCFTALLIATLTRPEGFMVFIILTGLGLILSIERQKNSLRDFLLPVLLYICFFSIYFIWRFNYYGYLLPNTFYAKTGGTLHQYLRGAIYSGFFTAYFLFPLLFLFVLLLWEKGCSIAFKKISFQSLRLHVENHIGIYVSGLICLIYALYIVYVGGDYMAMYRFFVPLLPLIYILFGLVINALFSSVHDAPTKRAITWILLIFAVAFTIFHSTPFENKVFRKPQFQHGHFRGVEKERWHSARLSLIGKFFCEYKRSNNESLATGAIGAVSYYSDLKIYGLHGLVDTYIAHKNMKGIATAIAMKYAGHEKEDLEYIFSKKPTYFMFERELSKEPLIIPSYLNKFVEDNYKLSSVWLIDKKNREEGFFTFLELNEHDR